VRRPNDKWVKSHAWPLTLPFWTFFVVDDEKLEDSALGEGEFTKLVTASNGLQMPYPVPIGSGDKIIEKPIRLLAGALRDQMFNPNKTPRNFATIDELNETMDALGAKAGILIAHEIAHALGCMHGMRIERSGAFKEKSAGSILTIMSSTADSTTSCLDMTFSAQTKVMWKRCFGVSPTFNDGYLANKTWGANWDTVGWSDRLKRFLAKQHENGRAVVDLMTPMGTTPPFASTSKPQRGTKV